MERSKPLTAVFYRAVSGNEPVREWLQSLTKPERFRIGVDLWKVQAEWPIGMPHVRPLGGGMHEARSSLPHGIARVLFVVDRGDIVLLHGFIKKTQKTPAEALALAEKGDATMNKVRKSNPRRGGSLNDFLKEEGIYGKVAAQAEKEILAWKLQSAMKEKKLTVSALAKRMHTSRAAINRILDPANPSITLGTLEKTAFALGKRWRFELVDA